MQEHPNATRAREMTAAMSRGEWQKLDDYIADDVVWHEIGSTEPRRGKEALRAVMAGAGEPFEITYETHDVVANDDHTIVIGEATATRGGRTLTYRTAEIFHMRDGKVTERWAFSDDTAAIIDFFA